MGFMTFIKAAASKLDWFDIALIKWSSVAFALMAAKLWPALLSLDWQWYLSLCLLFAIRPWFHYFSGSK